MRVLVLGGSLAVAASLVWASIVPTAEAMQVGQSAAAAQGNEPLPGDATSLQEMHGDWRVACVQQNGRKVCALSQQLTDKDTGKLLLAIEVNAPANGKAEGTLILPFGLALDQPVTLQIDDAAAGPALSFRTCLPVGCLVSVAFDPTTVALLRKGTTLTVKVTAYGGQGAVFKISLNGFSSALDRTTALAK
jgi:invasion protein IalB